MNNEPSFRWTFLKTGDLINIVAPGSSVTEEQLRMALEFVRKAGYSPECPSDLLAPELFLSNSDESRARHLIAGFHEAKTKAVWCLRSGYGSNRIMPFLTKVNQPKKIKIFMGSSDATPIHLFLNTAWNWPTLWCPALDKVSSTSFSPLARKEIGMILNGKTLEQSFSNLKALNSYAQFNGELRGQLLGGNLSSLCATIGTPWQFNAKKYILLLEEKAVRAPRIDMLLEQLGHVGIIEKAQAVVFTNFSKCNEPDGSVHWPMVLEHFASKYEKPFLFIPQGSGTDNDRPIPLGTQATLVTGVNKKFICATNERSVTKDSDGSTVFKIS